MAVEVRTKPVPATKLGTAGYPKAKPTDPNQGRHRKRNLKKAQVEDLAPHFPKPRRLHFQPNDEKKQHDPQFGDMDDGLRIVEEPKAKGPHRQPRGQIPQDRPQAQPPEKRYRDDCCTQQHDHGREVGRSMCGGLMYCIDNLTGHLLLLPRLAPVMM